MYDLKKKRCYTNKSSYSQKEKKIPFPTLGLSGTCFQRGEVRDITPFSAGLQEMNSTCILLLCIMLDSKHFKDTIPLDSHNHLLREVTMTSLILHLRKLDTQVQ